jgi:hypothetical protein
VAYVEILVIVGIVLVLGLFALQLLGAGMDQKADKQAACIQSFGCGAGAGEGTVAIPGAGGADAPQPPASGGFWSTVGSYASRAFVGVELDLGKVRLAGSASPGGVGGRVQSIPVELFGANALGGRVTVTTDVSLTNTGAVRGTAAVGAGWGPASADYIVRYDAQNGASHGLTGQIARQAPVVGIKIFGIGARIVVGIGPPAPAPPP